MRLLALIFAITFSAMTIGCAAPAAPAPQARLLVPSSVIRHTDAAAQFLLPTNSLAEAYIPRGQRETEAPNIAEGSAYTIYTYDAQRIGLRNEGSIRYTWAVKQGISIP